MARRWRNRAGSLVGLLVLLLAAGCWLVWTSREGERMSPEKSGTSFSALQTPAAKAPSAADEIKVDPISAKRQWAMSFSEPLIERLDALQSLAESGDRQAACWLALEYSRCRGLAVIDGVGQAFGEVLEHQPLPGVSRAQEDDLLLGIADARERYARNAAHCRGISEFVDNPGVPLLQAVVEQGSVRQKVVAALMQPDGSILRLPREAVIPLTLDTNTNRLASQFYADHALDYLQQGFRAGDALALEGLILVHAPDVIHVRNNTDVAFRLPDPRLFSALALLAEQLYGGEMLGPQARNLLQRSLESMTEQQRQVLERDVQIEALRWQRARPPPEESASNDYSELCR